MIAGAAAEPQSPPSSTLSKAARLRQLFRRPEPFYCIAAFDSPSARLVETALESAAQRGTAAMTHGTSAARAATSDPISARTASISPSSARSAAIRPRCPSSRAWTVRSTARIASGACAAPRSPLGTRGTSLAPPSRSHDPGRQPTRVVSLPNPRPAGPTRHVPAPRVSCESAGRSRPSALDASPDLNRKLRRGCRLRGQESA